MRVDAPVPPSVTARSVASVSTPAELKDEVAVAPKYALLKTERIVDDAPPVNWWRAVHVGAIA